jgi:hypothetical protein
MTTSAPATDPRDAFRRYADLIAPMLTTPATFAARAETASTVQVERGGALLAAAVGASSAGAADDHVEPAERLIELANAAVLDRLTVVDARGHARAVYLPLLVYAWLTTFRLRYETLPTHRFSRWETALKDWSDRLESELGRTRSSVASGTIAESAWTALALHVAGKVFIRDAWTDLAADTFGRLARGQQPSGAFLPPAPGEHPELTWYHELSTLHAAASYAVQAEDRPLARAVARATAFHLAEIQPDHATAQPWGLFAFVWDPAARPLADQLLHAASLQHARGGVAATTDGVSLILLADALYCLRLFLA